jgi:hypothetical protein
MDYLCRSCKKYKVWEPLKGGGEWYNRKYQYCEQVLDGVEVWRDDVRRSPHCRGCMNERRTSNRRRRVVADRLAPIVDLSKVPNEDSEIVGTCDVCGEDTPVEPVTSPKNAQLCSPCRSAISTAKDLAGVKVLLLTVSRHNVEETRRVRDAQERLRIEKNLEPGNRRFHEEMRRPHLGNTFGSIKDHWECLKLERRLLAALKWWLRPDQQAG